MTGAVSLLQAESKKVDFATEVKPIFEAACIGCHNAKKDKGGYRMDTMELAFKGGDEFAGEVITPKNAEESAVYWMTTLPKEDDLVMPPKDLLTASQQETIKNWILQGADWPKGVTLVQTQRLKFDSDILPILKKGGEFTAKQKENLKLWVHQGAVWPEGFSINSGIGEAADANALADNMALVEKIRETIIANSTETSFDEMKEYESTIPKTGAKYQMVPIPGGEFLMGSPSNEDGRFEGEGPQRKVKVEPFWMGKFEVTWGMYEDFMITEVAREKNGAPKHISPDSELVDVISSPTSPYTQMSFGMGDTENFPAIAMTQHAAIKFCQWLSAQTGHYYRLPTEAEWEYACRAGTTGPYHCKPEELGEYAVFDPDQTRVGYAEVGTKKPNPWGLYDMHGNVMEWCLDQYAVDSYSQLKDGVNVSPLALPTTLYPRSTRGGSWYDPAEELRAARRIGSEESWKVQDPQLPKSIWYHTDAIWLGFRIVRPLKVPSSDRMNQIWNLGVPKE